MGGAPALFILSRRLGAGDHAGVRRAYEHAVRIAYLVGIPVSIAIVVLHQPIVDLVLGPKYAGVGPLLGILASSAFLAILSSVQGALILAVGCTKTALRASLLILVVATGLDLALISAFGARGAAWATVGAAVTSCVVFDAVNRRAAELGTSPPARRLLVASALSALVLVAVVVSVPSPWSLVGLLAIPVVLVACRVVTPGDVRELSELVRVGHRTRA